MNSYTIQSISLWLRRHGAHEDENVMDLWINRSREGIETRFGACPHDMSESSDEQFMMNHYYNFMEIKTELEECYYFDGQLKRWINVKGWYKTIQAFAKTMSSA